MTQPAPLDDRLLSAFRALVRAELSRLTYLGVWTYTVQSVAADGSTADVQAPVVDGFTLPDIGRCPVFPGLLGEQVKLKVGSKVRVRFANADPSQPEIIGTSDFPDSSQIGSSHAAQPVARLGDQVVVFLPPTMPVVGTVSGSPFTGTITVVNPVTGVINSGSSKAVCGS